MDNAIMETIRKCTFKYSKNKENGMNKWFNNELKIMKINKINKHDTTKMENTNEACVNVYSDWKCLQDEN